MSIIYASHLHLLKKDGVRMWIEINHQLLCYLFNTDNLDNIKHDTQNCILTIHQKSISTSFMFNNAYDCDFLFVAIIKVIKEGEQYIEFEDGYIKRL